MTNPSFRLPALLLAMVAAAGCHKNGHNHARADERETTESQPGAPQENDPPEKTDMNTEECARAIQAIENRDFRDWQGLPAGCRWETLSGALPADTSELPFRNLGTQRVRTPFVQIELPGYKYPRLSLRDGRVIMFDGREPALARDSAALEAALGEPAARLDWYYGTFELASGERVYPDRGITIFVNPELDKVLHIALYAPTTLEQYQTSLRLDLEKKLRPLKKF